ncbi:MAG: hypothetical protein HQM16_11960 [Deltaproteobacteria bacterium]|nr:hypothetical protein [Deltaproteobacteria bacterium]
MIINSNELRTLLKGTHDFKIPEALPQEVPYGFTVTSLARDPREVLVKITETPEGEVQLFQTMVNYKDSLPMWQKLAAYTWLYFLKHQDYPLYGRPFVRMMHTMFDKILPLVPDNYTTESRTPWGGTRISQVMKGLSASAGSIIGEAWVISGHKNFSNKVLIVYEGYLLQVPLWFFGKLNTKAMFGFEIDNDGYNGEPPITTKLLNSGSWLDLKKKLHKVLQGINSNDAADTLRELLAVDDLTAILDHNYHKLHQHLTLIEKNLARQTGMEHLAEAVENIHEEMLAKNLSIQVHPTTQYCVDHPQKNQLPKAEAWFILEAENGAGFYLGLKEGVTKETMQEMIENGEDITDLLNFIEAKPGDCFFVPAGTVHALSAGLLLVEPQATSDTTFRYYDYNRRDITGNKRGLHVWDALGVTNWQAPRGSALIEASLRRIPKKFIGGENGMALYEKIVKEPEFSFDKITFAKGDSFGIQKIKGIHGLVVTKGCVTVEDQQGNQYGEFLPGQSFVVPHQITHYRLLSTEASEVFVTRY